MSTFRVCIALLLFVALVWASSHSESPDTAKNSNSDISDLYAFRSYEPGRQDYVTLIMNVQPLQNPYGGPNYFSLSDAHYYEILIDNDGDGEEDLVFQFRPGQRFNVAGPNVTQDVPDADMDCTAGRPAPEATFRSQGLSLNISGVVNDVPLKFIGPISAGNEGSLNWFEYSTLTVINGNRASAVKAQATHLGNTQTEFRKPMDYAGTKTFGDATQYEAYAATFRHDVDLRSPAICTQPARLFIGQRASSFSIDLGRVFDLVNMVPIIDVGVKNCIEHNRLKDNNVGTFVLELHKDCVLGAGQDTFGVWAATRILVHNAGVHSPGRQVSRLGNPLVNELVIGISQKGLFNDGDPNQDAARGFGKYVTNPTLPTILNLLFPTAAIAPTNIPRTDLVAAFLTGIPTVNKFGPVAEYMRLNTSIPITAFASQSNLGALGGDFAGFPNGRRPGDDVVDIALRVVMGQLCHFTNDATAMALFGCVAADAPSGTTAFGDGAPQQADQFYNAFPYLTTPNPGAVPAENPLVCAIDTYAPTTFPTAVPTPTPTNPNTTAPTNAPVPTNAPSSSATSVVASLCLIVSAMVATLFF